MGASRGRSQSTLARRRSTLPICTCATRWGRLTAWRPGGWRVRNRGLAVIRQPQAVRCKPSAALVLVAREDYTDLCAAKHSELAFALRHWAFAVASGLVFADRPEVSGGSRPHPRQNPTAKTRLMF